MYEIEYLPSGDTCTSVTITGYGLQLYKAELYRLIHAGYIILACTYKPGGQ